MLTFIIVVKNTLIDPFFSFPSVSYFSRNSPAPAVTAASVTSIQASEVSVPQANSSESSGGKKKVLDFVYMCVSLFVYMYNM